MTIEAFIDKRFGKGFHLEVDFRTGGGCLGILGASGCGKSMTLKCIAGIESPDRGRIVVNGRVLFDSERGVNVRPQDRKVGFLFQNYALFPRMTIERNIGIGIAAGGGEKRRIVTEMLGLFRLEGLEKRFPDQLSGGQQQRAALARMLAADPEILLLDEPFSALDTYLREHMQMQLLEVLKNYRDVVMVTHSRDEAYRLCSDMLVLDGGRVLGRGPTRDLFANPGHLHVARITGCKNISRLERLEDGRVRALDWGLTLATPERVPGDAAYVGIRAHDLMAVDDSRPLPENSVEIEVTERSEDLFEWNVLFRNAQAANDSERGEIWWKCGKNSFPGLPRRISMPSEALLFLRGE